MKCYSLMGHAAVVLMMKKTCTCQLEEEAGGKGVDVWLHIDLIVVIPILCSRLYSFGSYW